MFSAFLNFCLTLNAIILSDHRPRASLLLELRNWQQKTTPTIREREPLIVGGGKFRLSKGADLMRAYSRQLRRAEEATATLEFADAAFRVFGSLIPATCLDEIESVKQWVCGGVAHAVIQLKNSRCVSIIGDGSTTDGRLELWAFTGEPHKGLSRGKALALVSYYAGLPCENG